MTELQELIAGADSVELKLTVPESDQRSAIAALGLDPLDAQVRQVYFFDTPDLALDSAGVVVRARRIQNKAHDSVVKLRPAIPSELPRRLRRAPEFTVEVDAMPGGHVCSASMKNTLGSREVHRCVAGERPLRKLFSKSQREFYATHAPEGIEFDDLERLGPIFVLKLKATFAGLDRRLATEVWLYPNDRRILELSTRCAPGEAQQVADELRAFLHDRGIDASGEQETKTRTALEFFSSQLQLQ